MLKAQGPIPEHWEAGGGGGTRITLINHSLEQALPFLCQGTCIRSTLSEPFSSVLTSACCSESDCSDPPGDRVFWAPEEMTTSFPRQTSLFESLGVSRTLGILYMEFYCVFS